MCRPKHEGGLGFQNLYAFNLALVAKQLWRLFHNPHSLVARLLKARYYKDCSILEASLGNSPSYVWKSLCEAKVVIERRSRWRIGDGKNVRNLGRQIVAHSRLLQGLVYASGEA
ncbi:hypothetical protein L3X38_016851 [Prunus dulcis]|uniref:Reverse transcriptase n=1 Tax=Prunus dulcis TaxID=3755 RepID=A0AAD4W622_PRUDU|nr:hypothetical protein L3X38_016851 [Prunus dulcis]